MCCRHTTTTQGSCQCGVGQCHLVPETTKVIHIDLDPEEIARVYPTEITIVSDPRLALRALIDEIKARGFKGAADDHFIRMGWSIPGLIGASLANPSHPAIAFVGDGSFMMTGTAVATAVEYDIPAVWVILNNRSVQFERRMKDIYGKEIFCDYRIERMGELWNPDFVKVAEALGAEAVKLVPRR
ncbi:MAG: thiamine pyrophosphate-dependent enzyme [Candidatus Methylomirabilia bacterium]